MSCTVRTVPPKPGCMPSSTSGSPNDELGIVGADPIGAGQREFQAAAQREAVQRGNARAGQILELICRTDCPARTSS